jgi:hypothetical protein
VSTVVVNVIATVPEELTASPTTEDVVNAALGDDDPDADPDAELDACVCVSIQTYRISTRPTWD